MTKGNDWFLVANDFADYLRAQEEADACYRDADEWTRRCRSLMLDEALIRSKVRSAQ